MTLFAAMAFGAVPAQAYQAAPGWVASDYATGLPTGSEGGPVGLAFDSSGNLLVADSPTASLYKVAPGGGSADGSKLRDGYGQAEGLAFAKDGRLYLARGTQHDVVELNPASGAIVRTVVSGLPCPVGLATDPVSGDLFVSNVFCRGGGIMRITRFAAGPGSARRYAGTQDADGLTFAPDGTLYAAGGTKVVRIAGTSSGSPGAVTDVVQLPAVDGIAYAPATAHSGDYLVVNRNDGEIDRVGFDGSVTPVLTGGSRGDFVTVGPDRCIYADLADRVIKLGPSTGACLFAQPLGDQSVLGVRASKRVVDIAVRARAARSVRHGRRFDLKLTVSNHSGWAAHTVVLTDTLPRGLEVVRTFRPKGVGCRRHGRTVTCRRHTLAGRRSFTVTLRALSVGRSSYTNSAKVKSNDLDPRPGNNHARSRTKAR